MRAESTGTGRALFATATNLANTAVTLIGGALTTLQVLSGTDPGADCVTAQLQNFTGTAYTAALPALATSAARGFQCFTTSALPAEFISDNNNAIYLQGNASWGPIRVGGLTTRPTNTAGNQLAYAGPAGNQQWMESAFADFALPGAGVGWRGFLSTVGGSALGQSFTAGPFTAINAAGWLTIASVSALAGNAPKTATRQILMRMTFSGRVAPALSNATLGVRIIDITADPGAVSPVFLRSGIGSGAVAGYLFPYMDDINWSTPHVFHIPITVPAVGDRTWRVDIESNGPGNISVRDISIDFLGML
jgi:hypothetical protein